MARWIQKGDGWHYDAQGEPDGNVLGGIRVNYFNQTPPPIRDSAGRPLRDANPDHIDMQLWAKEIEEQRARNQK